MVRLRAIEMGDACEWVGDEAGMLRILKEHESIELELEGAADGAEQRMRKQLENEVDSRVLEVEREHKLGLAGDCLRWPSNWLRILKGAGLEATGPCYAKLTYRGCKYKTDNAMANESQETHWDAGFLVPIWDTSDLEGLCVEVLERDKWGGNRSIGKCFLGRAVGTDMTNGLWMQLVGDEPAKSPRVGSLDPHSPHWVGRVSVDGPSNGVGKILIWFGGMRDQVASPMWRSR